MPAKNGPFVLPAEKYSQSIGKSAKLSLLARRYRPRNAGSEPEMATLARVAAMLAHPVSGKPSQAGRTVTNVGVAAPGCSVVEWGDDGQHTSVITINTTLPPIAGGANLAVGKKLYTFPQAGLAFWASRMNIAIIQSEGNITADTPDAGLGTTIASGAVAVLGGTAAYENILTGQTMTGGCDGVALSKTLAPTAGAPLIADEVDGPLSLYFNVADGWAADGDAGAALIGQVVLHWSYLGAGPGEVT